MRPIYESTSIVLMFLGKTPSPLALICKCFKPKYGVGWSQASTAHAGAGQAEERLCHFIKPSTVQCAFHHPLSVQSYRQPLPCPYRRITGWKQNISRHCSPDKEMSHTLLFMRDFLQVEQNLKNTEAKLALTFLSLCVNPMSATLRKHFITSVLSELLVWRRIPFPCSTSRTSQEIATVGDTKQPFVEETFKIWPACPSNLYPLF